MSEHESRQLTRRTLIRDQLRHLHGKPPHQTLEFLRSPRNGALEQRPRTEKRRQQRPTREADRDERRVHRTERYTEATETEPSAHTSPNTTKERTRQLTHALLGANHRAARGHRDADVQLTLLGRHATRRPT